MYEIRVEHIDEMGKEKTWLTQTPGAAKAKFF
jgi:hypothetical protein